MKQDVLEALEVFLNSEAKSRGLYSPLFVQDMLGTGSRYVCGSENKVAQAMWSGICG